MDITNTPHTLKKAYDFILKEASNDLIYWVDSRLNSEDKIWVSDFGKAVSQLWTCENALVLLFDDGSHYIWGDDTSFDHGYKAFYALPDEKKGKTTKVTNMGAQAELLSDHQLVVSGEADYGGDASHLQGELDDVAQVLGSERAFLALTRDKKTIAWGVPAYGGEHHALTNIEYIAATQRAFAVINASGMLLSWGGAKIDAILYQDDMTITEHDGLLAFVLHDPTDGFCELTSTLWGFIARTQKGKLISWGYPYQSDTPIYRVPESINTQIVSKIASTEGAFLVLCDDGRVITWDDPIYTEANTELDVATVSVLQENGGLGGDSRALQLFLENNSDYQTKDLLTTRSACAAFCQHEDPTYPEVVVLWGNTAYGGMLTSEVFGDDPDVSLRYLHDKGTVITFTPAI